VALPETQTKDQRPDALMDSARAAAAERAEERAEERTKVVVRPGRIFRSPGESLVPPYQYTRGSNPLPLSLGRYHSPRHPTHLEPRFYNQMPPCDVSSHICWALRGGSQSCVPQVPDASGDAGGGCG
jgi:hypothetical protein